VSRVGGKTQTETMKRLAGTLRLEYAQFLELEMFARFGQVLDRRTERTLAHGARIRAVLAQAQGQPHSLGASVALLLCVQEGVLDGLSLPAVAQFKSGFAEAIAAARAPQLQRLEQTGRLEEPDRVALLGWLRERAAGLGAERH
ncbi:MAG TPA: hypothetical protein VG963_33790, partial [Polyangiaceae bacterium]|nr:hypothetical protein [Polyangiaceae bacterium]